MFGLTAVAQTPDGTTPANEGVCDVLQGATPGLYGLCVAFCEAQDWADADAPITEAEHDMLALKAPSGRILSAYNKRRTTADIDMPCIKVQEPCPCWSADELALVDGYYSDGATAITSCHNYTEPPYTWQGLDQRGGPVVVTRAGPSPGGYADGYCMYRGEGGASRALFVTNGTLTPDEADACYSQHQLHYQTVVSSGACDSIWGDPL